MGVPVGFMVADSRTDDDGVYKAHNWRAYRKISSSSSLRLLRAAMLLTLSNVRQP